MSVGLQPQGFWYLPLPGSTSPAVGSKLFTYIANTSTKQATWTDSSQVTQSANPLIADANGIVSFWADPTLTYKYVWAPANSGDPPTSTYYTWNNVAGYLTIAELTQSLIGSILYPQTAAEAAASVTPTVYSWPPGNVLRYGAATNTDSTTAFQAAVNQFAKAGAAVYVPAGTYIISSQVSLTSTSATFVPGLRMYGDGQELTFIDNRVVGSCFLVSETANDGTGFYLGGYIRDMTVMTTTSPATSTAIEVKGTWQYILENLHLGNTSTGLTGDGIRITSTDQNDAAINVWIRNVRFDNCLNGINSDFSAADTQVSFIQVEKCFFQGCTNSGWYYAGGSGCCINSAFAAMSAPGLWIWYNGANNPQFLCTATSFENCGNASYPSVRIDALNSGVFLGVEIANTTVISGQAIAGVYMGSSGISGASVTNVLWDTTYVRIGTAGSFTPFTMFTLGTQSYGCRIANTQWAQYDVYSNPNSQIRYADTGTSNVVSDAFVQVPYGTPAGTVTLTMANGANNNFQIPQDGSLFDISGPTGVFNLTGIAITTPSGAAAAPYYGRELICTNASGQVLTLTHSSASSTAAYRLYMDNNSDVTINPNGTFRLIYNSGAGAAGWYLEGHG